MIKNILAVLACFAFMPAAHAETFNLFEPASGVLVGNPNTYVTTAAASSNVISLWSGTCNASSFLRGDGSCAAAGAGTVTSVGLTVPTGFSVSGSPVTTSGTLGITTTLSGVINGTGSGFAAATSSNVISLWSGTCNATTFLRGDGSCVAAGGGTPAGATTEMQYNDAGVFGADATLTYSLANRRINIGGTGADGMIRAGSATSTPPGADTGGTLTLAGGQGGATSGDGGNVDIQAGIAATLGKGGDILITARDGVGANQDGGDIVATTGVATGSGTAGVFTVNGQNVRDTALFTSGTLGVTRGGTGTTTSTGTGSVVLSASPTLTGTTTAATVAATAVTVGGNNVCQSTGTDCPAGAGSLPIRSISTTDNTLTTDCGKVIVSTGAGSQTFTLDADPAVNCVLTFINNGSASTSLAASTSLTWFNGSGTNGTGTRTIAVGGVVTATVFATAGTWQMWGSGVL